MTDHQDPRRRPARDPGGSARRGATDARGGGQDAAWLRGAPRGADERGAPPPQPAVPSLPEVLHAARERKGVDLYRAERDTKIRARYLAALERGDYRELPGTVYAKGFLRNYALYLGLDPEEVLGAWRRERGDQVRTETPLVVRRSVAAPVRTLSLSPSVVVAGLMIMVVAALGIYLAVQLLRFAKPPFLEVVRPATALVDATESATTYVIQGRSIAGATVTITSPGRELPYRETAAPDGTWSIEVDLRRGQNKFEISAVDPETGRPADTTHVVQINVPFLVIQAPTLTISQPEEGATFGNGAIPLEGVTTNTALLEVSAHWRGPPGTAPASSPDPTASGPVVEPAAIEIAEDGSFSHPLELTTGTWGITVTATSPEGKSTTLRRTVTVAYEGITVVVTTRNQAVWLKVWVDGAVDPGLGASGRTVPAGTTLTFTGDQTIEVRTGSSGATFFTLNGVSLGALGRPGMPETWRFEPDTDPVLASRR